jgi:hypothetical protein
MWHDSGTGADIAHLIFYSANFYTTTAVSIIDDHPPTTPLFLYLPYQNVSTCFVLLDLWPMRACSRSSTLCQVHAPNDLPPAWEQHNYSTFGAGSTYANMLHQLDEGCANVTSALRKQGLWNNSVVLFTADNVSMPAASSAMVALRRLMRVSSLDRAGSVCRGIITHCAVTSTTRVSAFCFATSCCFSSGDLACGVSDHMLRAAAGTWAHAGEGGTRVTAFVAGGLIPPNLRGTSSGAKLVIIADVSNPARSARLQLHVHVGDLRVRLIPRRG